MLSKIVPRYITVCSFSGCVPLLFWFPLHGCRCEPHHFLLHRNNDKHWERGARLPPRTHPWLQCVSAFKTWLFSLLSQGPLATLLPGRMTLWQHDCNPESPPNCNLRDANSIEKLIKIRRSGRQVHQYTYNLQVNWQFSWLAKKSFLKFLLTYLLPFCLQPVYCRYS